MSPRLLSVAGLIVALVFPLLGFQGAEADPFHEHIMVGGSASEQIQALALHLYHHVALRALRNPWPRTVGADPVRGDDCVSVVSIRGSEAAGVSVLALGSALPAGSGGCTVPAPQVAGPVILPPEVLLREVVLPIPDPPPRWS